MPSTADPRSLLQHLREEGYSVQSDGEKLLVSPVSRMDADLKGRIRDTKAGLLAELRREQVERLLDLVPVDPETGLPDLPDDEPATARQVRRLRELVQHPAFGAKRQKMAEIIEDALDGGLSQLSAWGLLAEIGRRIAERSQRE